MSELVRIHNPLSVPVIFTSAGHQIDGNKSAQGDLSDPVTSDLVLCGRLIVPSTAPKNPPLTVPKSSKAKENATNE